MCWLEGQTHHRVDSRSNPWLFFCPTLHPSALILREEGKRNSTIYWPEDLDWYLASNVSSLIEVSKWHIAGNTHPTDKFCISQSFSFLHGFFCQYFKIIRLHIKYGFPAYFDWNHRADSQITHKTPIGWSWAELPLTTARTGPCRPLPGLLHSSHWSLPVNPTEPNLQASHFYICKPAWLWLDSIRGLLAIGLSFGSGGWAHDVHFLWPLTFLGIPAAESLRSLRKTSVWTFCARRVFAHCTNAQSGYLHVQWISPS